MEYEESIKFYSMASKENSNIENSMIMKEAIIYYKTGDFDKSKNIIENLLEIEDLQYDLKNQCEKYLSMIDISV
jgi:tetratricopeptide (TPR) repeat protein